MNEEMLEMVRREYQETAERIETKSYYKWQEENKRALSFWGQVTMEIAYGCLSYECMIAEEPYLERIERERARNAVKEPMNVNGEVGGDVGKIEDGKDFDSQNPMFGEDWHRYFNKTYGQENVMWESASMQDIIDMPSKIIDFSPNRLQIWHKIMGGQ